MMKFFKIIEKIVWIIAALAIAAVLAMVFIGAFANLDKDQFDRSSYFRISMVQRLWLFSIRLLSCTTHPSIRQR